MLQKLQEKKELKRNAQGRKAYLREINVVGKNTDFKLMLEKIPCKKQNEDHVIFWKEQENALKAKGATGHRGTQRKLV